MCTFNDVKAKFYIGPSTAYASSKSVWGSVEPRPPAAALCVNSIYSRPTNKQPSHSDMEIGQRWPSCKCHVYNKLHCVLYVYRLGPPVTLRSATAVSASSFSSVSLVRFICAVSSVLNWH